MDHHTWLKDDTEFPPLGSTGMNGWHDYVLVAHDDDDNWERVDTATWADIVNKYTPVQTEFVKSKSTRSRPHCHVLKDMGQYTHHHHKIPHIDATETTVYDLAQTQKSRARCRYRGEAWMYQHRVRVLTRIGYGSTIQGHKYDDGDYPSDFTPPVHYPSFIHCWRYVCKEDPEPEVDRLRKATVRSLLNLTS